MDVVGDDGVEVDEGGAAHLAEVQQAVQLGGMSNLSLRRENKLLRMKGGAWLSMRMENTRMKRKEKIRMELKLRLRST